MNWNEPHNNVDYDNVFMLLESGRIIHVPTHRVTEKVVGWMTVDQYIQQTKAEVDKLNEELRRVDEVYMDIFNAIKTDISIELGFSSYTVDDRAKLDPEKVYALMNRYDVTFFVVLNHIIKECPISQFIHDVMDAIGWVDRKNRNYNFCREFLVRSLEAESHYTRDAASIGLMYMGDPQTLPALRTAMEKENSSIMKKAYAAAIESIEGEQSE